ncbi:uncharacterized protein F4812DRAFT_443178 [Daldinia caldariorum]|uniref:uncharacterized protein n=1 Tax=Daldinia caldariorum TaxID=326644 RepID=UPI00200847FB|nr:uncharacterized protein F4812DRAFT_443178 [Daldinia caldariorum]KAI1464382.1 hypothetical protein F4812DRAFT_443178 [Daldinia caldariorum]
MWAYPGGVSPAEDERKKYQNEIRLLKERLEEAQSEKVEVKRRHDQEIKNLGDALTPTVAARSQLEKEKAEAEKQLNSAFEELRLRDQHVKQLEDSLSSLRIRTSSLEASIANYVDSSLGSIPSTELFQLLRDLGDKTPMPQRKEGPFSLGWIVEAPWDDSNPVAFDEIRPSTVERVVQLTSALWASVEAPSYPPAVFELFRLITVEFANSPAPAVYRAIPRLACALKRGVGAKSLSEQYFAIMAYHELHKAALYLFGEQGLEDHGTLGFEINATLGSACDKLIKALDKIVSLAEGQDPYETFNKYLKYGTILIGKIGVMTSKGCDYCLVLDFEKNSFRRVSKSLVSEVDYSEWPLKMTMSIASPSSRWRDVIFENVAGWEAIWWAEFFDRPSS